MSGPEFFQTLMGRKFYEHDVPEIGRQLTRLNENLERLTVVLASGVLATGQVAELLEALKGGRSPVDDVLQKLEGGRHQELGQKR
jgi:hypothetical protein